MPVLVLVLWGLEVEVEVEVIVDGRRENLGDGVEGRVGFRGLGWGWDGV